MAKRRGPGGPADPRQRAESSSSAAGPGPLETEILSVIRKVGSFDFDDVRLNIGSASEGTTKGFVSRGKITQAGLLETIRGLTMANLIDALTNGGAYVEVHTLDFFAGEIRGQIG